MPSYYTVQEARSAGQRQSPHGPLAKWYLTLADDSGASYSDVYTQKKPENVVSVGERIFGRVEEGEYGLRFFGEDPNQAGTAPQASPQTPPPPAQSQASDLPPPDTSGLPPVPQKPAYEVVTPPRQAASGGGFNFEKAKQASIGYQHAQKVAADLVIADAGPGTAEDLARKVNTLADILYGNVQGVYNRGGGAL